MNLSSARAFERSREVGIRKVLGSTKTNLVAYFISESLLFALMASVFGLLIILYFLPFFNSITGIQLKPHTGLIFMILVFVSMVSGFLAGIYPALIQSSFKPIRVLKGNSSLLSEKSGKGADMKKILVGFQFAISFTLIISTLITFEQFSFLRNKKLGFDTEQIISITNIPSGAKWTYKTFRNELLSDPNILAVSACMEPPSREIRDSGPLVVTGLEQSPNVDIQVIDTNFLDFMHIEILAGKALPKGILDQVESPEINSFEDYQQYIAGNKRAYMINESALRSIGWEDPSQAIGKEVSFSIGGLQLQKGPITGVVKDFHHETLKNVIDPLVMVHEPIWLNTVLVKIRPENMERTLEVIKASWKQHYAELPFEYSFIDELFEKLYVAEQTQFRIMTLFSGLAIFVALLGIFGLMAYTIRKRLKEIAIRKVLGASINSIFILFSRELMVLFIPALIVAVPVSWYFMSAWLDNFAYRIHLSPVSFFLGILSLILVIGTTVAVQISRSANVNPAEVLKDE